MIIYSDFHENVEEFDYHVAGMTWWWSSTCAGAFVPSVSAVRIILWMDEQTNSNLTALIPFSALMTHRAMQLGFHNPLSLSLSHCPSPHQNENDAQCSARRRIGRIQNQASQPLMFRRRAVTSVDHERAMITIFSTMIYSP